MGEAARQSGSVQVSSTSGSPVLRFSRLRLVGGPIARITFSFEPAQPLVFLEQQCDVADAKSVPATGQFGGKNDRGRFRFNGRLRSTQSL